MYKEFMNPKSNYVYFDKKITTFSNIAAGLLIRSIGEGLKIAYIDAQSTSTKLINFIENLSLSSQFTKNFGKFQLDIYRIQLGDKVSKTLIPLVEFCNIDKDMFYNSLQNYDLIIIDNLNFEKMSKIKIISILKNKKPTTQIIATCSDSKVFNEIKNEFNYKIVCHYQSNKSLTSRKGITNIIGKCAGKSLYAFGYLINSYIYKKNVKLIYFDKGDNIYGDAYFFSALKKWGIKNNLYGNFDFVKTGIKRYTSYAYRHNVDEQDKREAKDALMLLETSLKKQTPVIADEFNTVIDKGIITVEDAIPVLNTVKNELIITGEKTHKKIAELSDTIIEFKDE